MPHDIEIIDADGNRFTAFKNATARLDGCLIRVCGTDEHIVAEFMAGKPLIGWRIIDRD